MGVCRLIGRLLAVLVIAGLVVAPLVTPAAAMGLSGSGMGGMASMSGDMPCCPDHQKSNDCHDCTVVAMCITTFVQAAPAMVGAILIRQPTRTLPFALDDTISDGLDRPPPDHPPRTLV